ncbi:TPA: DUF2591 domain-containing protein [Klebsiella pneumoniae]|nr:DUF2591 domain-containing protein [Klebsiella pneumoniae]
MNNTDYSKMSDFEINKMICDVFWHDLRKSPECENKSFPQNTSIVYMHNGYGGFSRDYCNNPADAWPIIVGNKLSLINADDKWLCVTEGDAIDGIAGDPVHMIYSDGGVEHENPLRAAMIVFLKMQESKNISEEMLNNLENTLKTENFDTYE